MAVDLTPDYAASLGRIGGALLSDNLVNFENSQAGDLSFDTDLLYLDVANKRIGINNYGTSPVELYLGSDQTLNSVNLIVDGYTYNNNWTFNSNNISNASNSAIYITPAQSSPKIVSTGVGVANINLTSAGFSNPTLNGNINLTPDNLGIVNWTGNGQVNGSSTMLTVTGNVGITGNFEVDGTLTFGDQTTDTVSFAAEVNSNVLPSVTLTDNLGSSSLKWNSLYSNTITIPNITTTTLNAGGIQITGNTITSINSSNDITLLPTGTGNVKVNGSYPFIGNNIVNSNLGAFSLKSTSDGFWNFANKTAIVFPVGTTAQRPSAPTIGTTRYNTDLAYTEIYTGTAWTNVSGTGGGGSAASAVVDIDIIYDLILG
jgi:hypothetical protein